MEKYTKFADKATGINPFIPLKSKKNFLPKLLKLVLKFSNIYELIYLWANHPDNYIPNIFNLHLNSLYISQISE